MITITNPLTGETLNNCGIGPDGFEEGNTCAKGSGGGSPSKSPKPLKAPTPQGIRKVFDSVGAEMSGAGSAPVIGAGKIQIGTVKADTRGFKFKKGFTNKEEVEVTWKTGSYFSESAFKKTLETFQKAKTKLQEMGYEVQTYDFNATMMTVRKPKAAE